MRIGFCCLVLMTLFGCSDDTGTGNTSQGGGGNGSGGEGGAGGLALPAEYQCVGSVVLQDPGADTLDATLAIVAPSPGLTSGVEVRACARTDTVCASPVATGVTDADGQVELALPMGQHGFDGYGEINGPALFPELVQSSRPLIPEAGQLYSYSVYDAGVLAPLLQQAFGIDLDPSKGYLQIFVNDCNDLLGAGISVSVAGAEELLYVEDQVPVPGATATTADGQVLAINVPPGEVAISGTIEGTDIVFAQTTGLIRAGTLTLFFLSPTP